MNSLTHEALGVAAVGGAFGVLLLSAELWKRRGAAPERTRKCVHLFGGLVCLSFPYLFQSAWSVLCMALTLTLVIATGRRFRFLQSLHSVGRRTSGSEFYPLSICLLFFLTRGAPWLYVCSVLVLAVGDAFAALIGIRYGTVRYEVEDEQKSLEGSLAFFTLAFFAIHLPLLLLTDLPRATCVLAAMLVAVLVTGFEAISLRGTDNLFVPLAVAVILAKITTKPLREIIFQNVSLLLIGLGMVLVALRTRRFNTGGTIVMVLFAYGAWSLGSWAWAQPVLIGYGVYSAMLLLWPDPAARRGAPT